MPSVSASESAKASTAVGSAVSGVVVAAIPAALAYFVGWAYLHYYLAEFGIGIAELELGTETIFIYAAPPVFLAVKSFWWLLLLLFPVWCPALAISEASVYFEVEERKFAHAALHLKAHAQCADVLELEGHLLPDGLALVPRLARSGVACGTHDGLPSS